MSDRFNVPFSQATISDKDIAEMWNANAETWTSLSRQGYDTYRDHINTPAFLAMLPNVANLKGLDIGCGEGGNTRLLAARGAHMTGVDISNVFIQKARDWESASPQGIHYVCESARRLPFQDGEFDFAVAFMSLMDMVDFRGPLQEAHRVLKPAGLFQFSILHPCFHTPKWEHLRDSNGHTSGIVCGDYFSGKPQQTEWMFSALPVDERQRQRPFRYVSFFHTLSDWLNAVIATGFSIENIHEPCPSPEVVAQHPNLEDASCAAYFLIVQLRKKQ